MSWKVQRWVLLAVVCVYVAMRVYRGAAICMDGDEIFSVGVAAHDWTGLLRAVGQDSIHPPLFYFLLKLWVAIGGDSLFWTRLLPTVFATLAIIPMVLLGPRISTSPRRHHYHRGAGRDPSVSALLLAARPHVHAADALRAYVLMGVPFVDYVRVNDRRPRGLAVLTVVNIVSVYSHYYGWLVIGLECWYLVFWKRDYLKRMALSCAHRVRRLHAVDLLGGQIYSRQGRTGVESRVDSEARRRSARLVLRRPRGLRRFPFDRKAGGHRPRRPGARRRLRGVAPARQTARRPLRLPGALPAVLRARVGGRRFHSVAPAAEFGVGPPAHGVPGVPHVDAGDRRVLSVELHGGADHRGHCSARCGPSW